MILYCDQSDEYDLSDCFVEWDLLSWSPGSLSSGVCERRQSGFTFNIFVYIHNKPPSFWLASRGCPHFL